MHVVGVVYIRMALDESPSFQQKIMYMYELRVTCILVISQYTAAAIVIRLLKLQFLMPVEVVNSHHVMSCRDYYTWTTISRVFPVAGENVVPFPTTFQLGRAYSSEQNLYITNNTTHTPMPSNTHSLAYMIVNQGHW